MADGDISSRGEAESLAGITSLREVLEKAQSTLLDHHQWHGAQLEPDPVHGYIPADEYADSGLCEKTLDTLGMLRTALESK